MRIELIQLLKSAPYKSCSVDNVQAFKFIVLCNLRVWFLTKPEFSTVIK